MFLLKNKTKHWVFTAKSFLFFYFTACNVRHVFGDCLITKYKCFCPEGLALISSSELALQLYILWKNIVLVLLRFFKPYSSVQNSLFLQWFPRCLPFSLNDVFQFFLYLSCSVSFFKIVSGLLSYVKFIFIALFTVHIISEQLYGKIKMLMSTISPYLY